MILVDRLQHALAEHCSLNCSGCMVYSPYLEPKFSDFETFKKDIQKLSTVMKLNKFQFIGGEPLLHPELLEFIREVKRSKIAKEVNVVTNGTHLLSMPDEFFKLISWIHISQYDETSINYTKLKNYLRAKFIKYNFRYSFSDRASGFIDYHSDEKLTVNQAQHAFNNCHLPHECHHLDNGRYYRCPISTVKNKFMDLKGIPVDYNFVTEDSIDLHSSAFSEEQLQQFLNQTTPLKTCEYCFGASHIEKTRTQLSAKEIKFIKREK